MSQSDTNASNILIIEDTPQDLAVLTRILTDQGYLVYPAISGALALKAAQKTLPDLILLDIKLPGMDGYNICRRFKADERTCDVPVIFISALDEMMDKVKAFGIGGVDYITKPFQAEEVLARVNVHLTMRELQNQLRIQNACLQENNEQLQTEIFVRKQAEEALKASEERYRRLVELSPEAIVVHQDEKLVYVNAAGVALLAANRPEELTGKPIWDVIHPDDHHIVKERLRRIHEKGEPAALLEEKFVRLDGQEIDVEVAGAPITYQDKSATQVVIRDITERKRVEEELARYHKHLYELVEERTAELTQSNTQLQQEIAERKRAEKALRKSERQYRALAENVADGIVIFQQGKFVFVNKALASMFNYPPEHLLRIEPTELLRENYKEQGRKMFEQIEQDTTNSYWQAPCMTGDNREIWVETHRSVIEWESTPAILMTVRDITARKLQEFEIKKERNHLRRENITLRSGIRDRYKFGEIIGKSLTMQEVYQSIVNASASDANVVICGESGTGKELVAQTIHQLSERKEQAFAAVNCGAVTESLFEREFFGHRKGAFTGATRDKPGYLDQTRKGTLFLDEVGELKPALQVKLLRVLQDGEFTPLGDTISKTADVRIIAATNKDLREQLQQGLIREDFFYRIRVIVINLPPLRDRKEDIPLLIEHFLEQYGKDKGRATIPGHIMEMLCAYHWPGNVRELQNELQRYLAEQRLEFIGNEPVKQDGVPGPTLDQGGGAGLREAVGAYEKSLIASSLAQNNWRQGKTAKMLAISPKSLYNKMIKYGLKNDKDFTESENITEIR